MQALAPDILEAAAHAKTMAAEEIEETLIISSIRYSRPQSLS